MRHFVLIVSAVFLLSSCENEHDRRIKGMESRIEEVIAIDWDGGIPLDQLQFAQALCFQEVGLRGCDIVRNQLNDLSITLSSCNSDNQSRLCKAVIEVIPNHPIHHWLEKSQPITLPHHPFYWKLPTQGLDARSGEFEYRKEAFAWWWNEWWRWVCSILLICLVAFGSYARCRNTKIISERKRLEEERVKTVHQERARARWQHQRYLNEVEGKKLQAERQEKIAEELRREAERQEREKAMAEAEKLSFQKAEAKKILDQLFD